MNIEAIIVIGIVCVILAIILLVPGLWWARRKSKQDPSLGKKVNFTPFGWVYLSVMLVMLLGGLCMQYLAPGSFLGRLTTTGFGRIFWAAFIIVLFMVIQKVLGLFGVFIEKREEKGKDV